MPLAPTSENIEWISWNAGTVKHPKLELGSVVTPFEYPDVATELMKCKRYYERFASTTAYSQYFMWQVSSATNVQGKIGFTEKRVAPAISAVGSFGVTSASGSVKSASGFNYLRTTAFSSLGQFITSGVVAGNACQIVDSGSASSYIQVDAEL